MFETLEAAIGALREADLNEVDDTTLGARIAALHRAEQQLAAERLRCLAEHDRRMAWKGEGCRSAKEWLAGTCGLGRGEAGRELDTARQLQALPETAGRLARGEITAAAAGDVARVAGRLDEDGRAGLDAAVAAADPDRRSVRAAADAAAHRHDQQITGQRERQAFERRRLALRRLPDGGLVVDGRLDVLGGEALLTAIGALAGRRGQEDDRTPEQRRADALAELARRGLDRGDLPEVGGERPHVTVVVPLEALEDRVGAGPARLDYGEAICNETARMLACDAQLTRVITRGASQVLDVGRASRNPTVHQRRALVVRDGGCRGCGAPPAWCHAHHLQHWTDGGPTDLHNLVLLCWTCHDAVHNRGWTVIRGPDGLHHLRPPPRQRAGPPRAEPVVEAAA